MENTFEKDLAFGDAMEALALSKMGLDCFRKIPGKFSPFDVICVKGNEIILREFKADRWTHKTGNVAIECISSGKASGIQKTQADFWCICVWKPNGADAELYDIPVSVLKDLINRQEYTAIKEVAENGKNICYLFPVAVFSQYRI